MAYKLNKVELVSHDPSWKQAFLAEKEIIFSVINNNSNFEVLK